MPPFSLRYIQGFELWTLTSAKAVPLAKLIRDWALAAELPSVRD
jgi:hypothetical protein